jgi:hypothetical protein
MGTENGNNGILPLLEGLKARGLDLRVNGEQLLVGPRDKLTDPDREAIRQNKHAIMIAIRPPPQNGTNGNNGTTAQETDAEPRPVPPPGARLYFGDVHGRPCQRDKADHWCWEGGPRWFKVREYPMPAVAQTG